MADPLNRESTGLPRQAEVARAAPIAEPDTMQRVRIGLTGLCTVFVLVLLAAAVFGLVPAERGVVAKEREAAANASAADPKDPLAELGVTPGGSASEDAPATPPPAPATAPAPAAR